MQNPSVKKKRIKIDGSFLKIGQAAQALGVSIDTLRRWEKAGKISTVRTPGGTRLYHLSALKEVNPAADIYPIETYQSDSLSTEELLKRADLASQGPTLQTSSPVIPANAGIQLTTSDSELDPRLRGDDNFKKTLFAKFLVGTAFLSSITLLLTSWITASYLTQPKAAQQFFKNNVASGLISPFHTLAQEMVAIIDPRKAKELGFAPPKDPPPIATNYKLRTLDSSVLAVTASSQFLEVNADTQINGALFVRDSVNGLSLEATPSANSFVLGSGDTTLTVTNDALLDQDVSTLASPTFNTLNLSATSNQLVFQSGGPTGTLTWTPTAARVITLPDATGTVLLDSATQTITNKTINASNNTITNISNSALANSKVTVTAGTNLTGGGDINLGSSATISLKDSISLSGTLTAGGVVKLADGTAAAPGLTFTNDTDTGLYRIGANSIGLITGGSATSGITIDASGNVGIGTISPSYTLDVTGRVNGSTALCIGGDCKTAWSGVGGYTASNGITLSSTDFQLGGSLTRATGIDINSQNFGFLRGNVGIGITNPGSALTVIGNVGIGTSAAGAALQVNGGGLFGWGTASSALSSGAIAAFNGNVGIGTTSPAANLEVIPSSNSYLRLFSTTDAPAFQMLGNGDGANYAWFELGRKDSNQDRWQMSMAADGSNRLRFIALPTNSENLSLLPGGNVGIGASLPQAKFVVQGNVGIGYTGANQVIPANGLAVFGNVGIGTTTANSNLSISGNAHIGSLYQGISAPTDGLFVDGNVGIGATTSSNKLDVWGNARIAGTTTIDSTLTALNGLIGYSGVTAPSNGLAVSGNLGIGTTSPAAALEVIGSAILQGNLTFNADNSFDIGAANATRPRTGYFGTSVQSGVAMDADVSGFFGTPMGYFAGNASSNIPVVIVGTGANTYGAEINGLKTRATSTNANTIVQNNDELMALQAFGADGASYRQAAGIYFYVDGTPGSSDMPGRIDFATSPDGTITPITRMTIKNTGNIGIGATLPQAKLVIQGNVGIGYTGVNQAIPDNGLAVFGNVGIGTTTANSNLSISGNVHIGSLYQGTVAPTNGLFVDGNVGIGATTSSNKLDVWGAANITGNVGVGSSLTVGSAGVFSGGLTVNGGSVVLPAGSIGNSELENSSITVSATAGTGISVSGSPVSLGGTLTVSGIDASTSVKGVASFNSTNFSVSSGAVNTIQDIATTSSPTFVGLSLTSGNLGIGTSSTGAKLQVNGGGIFWPSTTSLTGPTNGLAVFGNVGIGTTTPLAPLHAWGNGTNSALFLNGNVGIGFTSPDRLTQLASDINITGSLASLLGAAGTQFGITGNSGSGGTEKKLVLGIDTTDNYGVIQAGNTSGTAYDLSLNPAGGNVGIGTTSPAAPLHILGVEAQLRLEGTSSGQDAAIDFYPFTPAGAGYRGQILVTHGADADAGRLQLQLANTSGTLTTRLYIEDGGNLGIGTDTTPDYLLELYDATNTPAFGLSDDDVAHGVTTIANTDTFFHLSSISTTVGGAQISGLADATGVALGLKGIQSSDPTDSTPAISLIGAKANGTGVQDLADAETILQIANNDNAPALTILGNGNVGIGATIPNATLSIQGNVGIGYTGVNQVIPSNGLAVFGNVGIGTTTANSNLSVAGSAHIGALYQSIAAPANGLFVDGNVGIGATTSSNKLDVWGNARVAGTTTIDSTLTALNGLIGYSGITAPSSGLAVSGNVGIGFTSPSAKLQLNNGQLKLSIDAGRGDTDGRIIIDGRGSNPVNPALFLYANTSANAPSINFYDDTGSTVYGRIMLDRSTSPVYTGTAQNDFVLGTESGTNKLHLGTNSIARLTVDSAGNIGIGITTVNSLLSVAGGAHIGALYQSIAAPANGLFVDGNVGIGATTSSNKLDVWGNARIAGTLALDSSLTLAGGQFLAPNGTSALPSFSFSGDTDTGLWNLGTNFLALTTNGAGALQAGQTINGLSINANGNVGIGTTNPTATLDVAGATSTISNTTGNLTITPASNLIISSGNVGIGFTSPDRKLQIGSDIDITGTAASILGANGAQFSITGSSANTTHKKLTLGIDTTDNYGVIQAGNTNGTAYDLALQPGGGNVGIGTTSPSTILGIGDSLDQTTYWSTSYLERAISVVNHIGTDNKAMIHLEGNQSFGNGVVDGIVFRNYQSTHTADDRTIAAILAITNTSYDAEAGNLAFYTHDTTTGYAERMRIDSGGNVGVGYINSPGAVLSVNGNVGIGTSSPASSRQLTLNTSTDLTLFAFSEANVEKAIIGYDSGGGSLITTGPNNLKFSSAGGMVFGTGAAVGPTPRMTIDSAGNVGIGYSVPAASLFSLTTNGPACSKANAGDTAFTACSSRDIKENIVPVSAEGILDKIANVPANTYDFINGDKNKMGLIAEDFYTVFNRGDGKSVNGQEVQMATWLGIQQLYQRDQQLRNAIYPAAGGNIGIGTSNPQYTLEVNGTGKLNDAAWTYASDLRLKENIASVSAGLSIIEQLNPVTFDYIQGGRGRTGFIAQEVQNVLPNLVTVGSDGMLGLRTEEILPYTVRAIQEQQTEINNLIANQATSSALSTNLSVSADGTLNVPKLQADKITLSADMDFATAPLNSLLTTNYEPTTNNYTIDVLASLGSISEAILGINTQESTTSAQLADLQTTVATTSASLSAAIASQSATTQNLAQQLASAAAELAQTRSDVEELKLTPPDILLATQSAQLVNLEVTSDATISGQLTAYDLDVQNALKSLGTTTLGSTLVAGDLNIDGTLSLTGSSLSTLSTLYIQNGSLAGPVDFFNGEVTLDKNGVLAINKLELPAEVLGEAIIPAGSLEIPVFTSAVTQKSKVFLTPTTLTGGQPLIMSEIISGSGFVVTLEKPFSSDIKFNWVILDQR